MINRLLLFFQLDCNERLLGNQGVEGREILLSRLAGATQVHVNLAVLPAGKQSCPFHCHLREEEHFYVLSGRCILRSGDDPFPSRPVRRGGTT